MKKTIRTIILGLMLASQPALAADKAPAPPKGSTPVPDGAPTAKDLAEPEITIRSRGRERIEEYRLKGKLYMLRVTPPKGRPYYLIDQTGRGEFTRHDGPVPAGAVPQWVIHSF